MNSTQNANYILGLMWEGVCAWLSAPLCAFPCEGWEDLAPGKAERWLHQIAAGVEYLDTKLNDSDMYEPCTKAW